MTLEPYPEGTLRYKAPKGTLIPPLLDGMRQRVDREIGPNRFAVALAPTKAEYLPAAPLFDPNAVPNGVLASLQRLGIPAIDGRLAITPADFWEWDGHWKPSGLHADDYRHFSFATVGPLTSC